MTDSIQKCLESVQDSVQRLVAECRKNGPLYGQHPKQVAQVNRTSKWLLNAITSLERELRQ